MAAPDPFFVALATQEVANATKNAGGRRVDAAPALLVGVPVGVSLGRWGWTAMARQLDGVAVPVVPVVALLLVVPGALVVANLAAVAPAWAARRTSPATALRSE